MTTIGGREPIGSRPPSRSPILSGLHCCAPRTTAGTFARAISLRRSSSASCAAGCSRFRRDGSGCSHPRASMPRHRPQAPASGRTSCAPRSGPIAAPSSALRSQADSSACSASRRRCSCCRSTTVSCRAAAFQLWSDWRCSCWCCSRFRACSTCCAGASCSAWGAVSTKGCRHAFSSSSCGRRCKAEGQQPIRDLDNVRSFMSSTGLTAFFDLPWLPVYVAVCSVSSPHGRRGAVRSPARLLAHTAH